LEEVLEADIIIHVRDISHPETEHQKQDVETVLDNLGVLERMRSGRSLEVLNKIDLMNAEDLESLTRRAYDYQITTSAITGAGCIDFVNRVEEMLGAGDLTLRYDIDPADGAAIAWLHQHGKVLEQALTDDHISVSVILAPDDACRFNDHISQNGGAVAES
jgi:GTP-binding protein HflX